MLAERRGEALTFSSLSKEAQVSRRTLYVHWGTIEQVISDAVTLQLPAESADSEGSTPREQLSRFLSGIRDSLHEPVTSVALTTLVNHAAQNEKAADALLAMGDSRISQFRAVIGPVDAAQYAQLVGPIYFAEFVARETASDELIETLVDRGVELLDLDEVVTQRSA